MGSRGEAECARHVGEVIARVLREVGRGEDPHQVDHPLEVGRAVGREAPAEVLARQLHLRGERLRTHRAAAVREHQSPDGALQVVGQAERPVRIDERRREPHREGEWEDELELHRILHAVHEQLGELELRAGARHVRQLGGPERREREERDAREVAREGRHRPVLRAGLREIHDHRIGERAAQCREGLVARAHEREAAAAAREGALEQVTGAVAHPECDDRRRRHGSQRALGHHSVRGGRGRVGGSREDRLRLPQHRTRVVVRDELLRLLERRPATGRDPLGAQR